MSTTFLCHIISNRDPAQTINALKGDVESFIKKNGVKIDHFVSSYQGETTLMKEFEQLENIVCRIPKQRFHLYIHSGKNILDNIEYLQKLKHLNIDFTILGFEEITPCSLDGLIQYIHWKQATKSKQIIEGLNRSKVIGAKKQSAKKRGYEVAKSARIRLKYTDPKNVQVRKKIQYLRGELKLPYREIARKLNNEGLTTRNGKQFYEKTIARIYKTISEIQEMFKTPEIAKIHNGKNILPPNFVDYILFTFKETIKIPLQYKIYNSQSVLVSKGKLAIGENQLSIDTLKEKNLFLGKYFIIFEPLNKDFTLKTYIPNKTLFTIRKDIWESLSAIK